jgi:hypothetical protein
MVIMMMEPSEMEKKDLSGENEPDRVIHSLSELLDIFPGRHSACNGQ